MLQARRSAPVGQRNGTCYRTAERMCLEVAYRSTPCCPTAKLRSRAPEYPKDLIDGVHLIIQERKRLVSAKAALVPASHKTVVAASHNARASVRAIRRMAKSGPLHSVCYGRAITAIADSVTVTVMSPSPVTPIGSHVAHTDRRSIAIRVILVADGIAICVGTIVVAIVVVRCRQRRTNKGSRRESDSSAAPSPTSMAPAAVAPTAADVAETAVEAKSSGFSGGS